MGISRRRYPHPTTPTHAFARSTSGRSGETALRHRCSPDRPQWAGYVNGPAARGRIAHPSSSRCNKPRAIRSTGRFWRASETARSVLSTRGVQVGAWIAGQSHWPLMSRPRFGAGQRWARGRMRHARGFRKTRGDYSHGSISATRATSSPSMSSAGTAP